jgi:hypothetical protein
METIKSRKRVPATTVDIADELVQDWLDAKKIASDAEKVKQKAQKAMLTALGDAEAGNCSMGLVTYLEQNRKGFTVEPSTSRVTRFKKAKDK